MTHNLDAMIRSLRWVGIPSNLVFGYGHSDYMLPIKFESFGDVNERIHITGKLQLPTSINPTMDIKVDVTYGGDCKSATVDLTSLPDDVYTGLSTLYRAKHINDLTDAMSISMFRYMSYYLHGVLLMLTKHDPKWIAGRLSDLNNHMDMTAFITQVNKMLTVLGIDDTIRMDDSVVDTTLTLNTINNTINQLTVGRL